MCYFVAGICTEESVLFGWSKDPDEMDSHKGIIKTYGLDDSMHGNFFRFEIKKPNSLTPFQDWKFVLDQTWTPSWYNPKVDEFRCRAAILESGILEAEAKYRKVLDLAEAKYRQLALAKCEKIEQLDWDEYRKVQGPAWAEYQKVRDLAEAEYVARRKEIAARTW